MTITTGKEQKTKARSLLMKKGKGGIPASDK